MTNKKNIPGRPKKAQKDKAPKNGTRDRKYSITIHDIKEDTKKIANERVNRMKPDWFLIGDEEYNHQDGHHLHIFLKYKEKKAFSKVLDYYEEFAKEFGLGRVQVDYGRGSFQKCEKYLVSPDKEKKIDDNVIVNVRKLTREEIRERLVARYPDEVKQCEKCFTNVYVGPPITYRDPAGRLVEVEHQVLCVPCSKIKSQAMVEGWLQATDTG